MRVCPGERAAIQLPGAGWVCGGSFLLQQVMLSARTWESPSAARKLDYLKPSPMPLPAPLFPACLDGRATDAEPQQLGGLEYNIARLSSAEATPVPRQLEEKIPALGRSCLSPLLAWVVRSWNVGRAGTEEHPRRILDNRSGRQKVF